MTEKNNKQYHLCATVKVLKDFITDKLGSDEWKKLEQKLDKTQLKVIINGDSPLLLSDSKNEICCDKKINSTENTLSRETEYQEALLPIRKLPKNPRNMFNFFCLEHRDRVRKEYPDESSRNIQKILADLWKNKYKPYPEKIQKYRTLQREHKELYESLKIPSKEKNIDENPNECDTKNKDNISITQQVEYKTKKIFNVLQSKFSYDEVPIYTATITAGTNLTLNIEKLFDFLECEKYIIMPKPKKSKKNNNIEKITNPNSHIKPGSIITLKMGNKIKGMDFKPKKESFKNNVQLIMILKEGKKINVKASNSGTLHFTGCKDEENDVRQALEYFWYKIKDSTDVYSFTDGNVEEKLTAVIYKSMRNIDVSIGFDINTDALHRLNVNKAFYISAHTRGHRYPGVNMKYELDIDLPEMPIPKYTWHNDPTDNTKLIFSEEITKFEEYLLRLKLKDRKAKLKKRYCTFLVFNSGKIIISCINSKYASVQYDKFIPYMLDNRKEIEKQIIPEDQWSEISDSDNESDDE